MRLGAPTLHSLTFACVLWHVSRSLFAQGDRNNFTVRSTTPSGGGGARRPDHGAEQRHETRHAPRKSNEQGQFVIALLPVGEYTVKVDHSGFTPFEQTSVLFASQHQRFR